MRVVIQRVSNATVSINGKSHSQIGPGLCILLGIESSDTDEDITWLVNKIANLRIFNDAEGLMNLALNDVQGELLVVSQFTLYASTKKGNRPSYIKAAPPTIAIPLYEQFVASLENTTKLSVRTGVFGADMQIQLTNNGPVTILIDSKNRE